MLSYIQLSRSNLYSNIKSFRKLLTNGTKLCAVIKGNAYGHGQNEIAKNIEDLVDYFQVDDINELRLLRKTSNKETFVFGYVPKDDLEKLVELNGIPGIYDADHAISLNSIAERSGKQIKIHIKIDALLGRQGLLIQDIPQFIDKIKNLSSLEIDGIYSHFSNIEDTDDLSHSFRQLEYFENAVKLFSEKGINIKNKHFSATSGILVGELLERKFNIARLGIGMYGLWPSESLQRRFGKGIVLKPVLSWITHVAQVKTVGKGFPIGYGLTYITNKDTTIAIVPQGYSDGYDRGLSNCGQVSIKGDIYSVVGRIAMNMFAIDVTGSKIREGDEVKLIGEDITAEVVANKLGTINYEVVARISPLLPRKIV